MAPVAIGLAVLVSLAAGVGADGKSRAKPNLAVAKVAEPPRTKPEGASFAAAAAIANRSAAKSPPSATRFYLTTDPKRSLKDRRTSSQNPRASYRDLRLIGARKVPALAPRTNSSLSKGRTRVRIPLATPAGSYHLLACADDRGAVAESKEADNCRATKKRIVVTALARPNRIDATSDSTPLEEPAQIQAEIARVRPQRCMGTPVQTGGFEVKQPVRRLETFLKNTAGADAMAAFRKSRDAKRADLAERAAAGALGLKQPGAALAALLGAHRLKPKEPSYLVSAASVATAIGFPGAALGMLNEADRLDERRPAPMGLNRQAIALNNRGQALLELGRWKEAERVLGAAFEIEPLLQESAKNLALALACQEKDEDAMKFVRRGKRRQDPAQPVDASRGKESNIRNLPYPPTPERGVAIYPFYRAQEQKQLGEIAEGGQRTNAIVERINQAPPPSRFMQRRLSGLQAAIGIQSADRKALYDKASDLWRQSTDITYDYFGMVLADGSTTGEVFPMKAAAGAACEGVEPEPEWRACYYRELRARCVPRTRVVHQAWLDIQTELDQTERAYFRAESKYRSGIAANVKDPDRHALMMEAIRGNERGFFYYVLDPAERWTEYLDREKEGCVETTEPPVAEEEAVEDIQASTPCDPLVKGVNLTVSIGPVKFKVNCEQLSAEVAGEGWISAFAEVGYNFRSGQTTVFAGAVGKAEVGRLGADFKSGIYLTAGPEGFEDAGWRVGPTLTGSGGVAEFERADQVDISFVGAVKSLTFE